MNSKLTPQIALFFGPEFSGADGQCHVLVASNKKGRTHQGRIHGWTLGRLTHCDFRLKGGTISRIHATIYYDRSFQSWYLVDGGEYPDVSISGGQSFAPSHNGVWLNGQKLTPGDPEVLQRGDKILLGPDLRHKIYVGHDCHDTFTLDPWAEPGWPVLVRKEQPAQEPAVPMEVRKELHKQAVQNSAYPNTIPGAIAFCLDLTQNVSLARLLIYGVIIVAIAVVVVNR